MSNEEGDGVIRMLTGLIIYTYFDLPISWGDGPGGHGAPGNDHEHLAFAGEEDAEPAGAAERSAQQGQALSG